MDEISLPSYIDLDFFRNLLNNFTYFYLTDNSRYKIIFKIVMSHFESNLI